MTIQIGIIGLGKSGKSTIFNALTHGRTGTGGYSAEAAHVGVAKVPEPRLQKLVEMLHPRKVVPAEVTYVDVGASVKSIASDKSLGGELLNKLSAVDAFMVVIRAFKNESIPHPEGSLDTARDIAAMDLELVFSDLAIIEHRLERIIVSLKGASAAERPPLLREQEVLLKIKAQLEKDIPIYIMNLTPEEAKHISNYQFLTAKPALIVVNISEDQIEESEKLEAELNAKFAHGERRVITFPGKLEMELCQLDDSAAAEFRATYELKECGLDRVIRHSYDLLGLITFFTTASSEARAWTIRKGTTAVKAAGKIHTDMERGFIRAEVIAFNDLVSLGGFTEARHKGLLRLEGKEYVVKDGDVITFMFNV